MVNKTAMRTKSKEVYFSELTQNVSDSAKTDTTKRTIAQLSSHLFPVLGILLMLFWIHLSLVNGKIFFDKVLLCSFIVILLCLFKLMDQN
jgi:hypothetical protein